MSEHQPVVVAVIVSYNTVALLRDCLNSLRACNLPLQVVVVDNASHDGSPAMVRAEFPEVTLVEAGYNAGFAGGTNLGLRHLGLLGDPQDQEPRSQEAKERLSEPRDARRFTRSRGLAVAPAPRRPASWSPHAILVLNPDTVVHPGAVEAMVAFLAAHPRVGLVGPRLLNPDGTPQAAAFRFPTLTMTVLDLFPPGEVLPGRLYGSWWHGRYPQERGDEPFPIDHPLGACMLVRATVLEQVGSMDERYFMYSEEIEWCWRLKAGGWAIWQVPAAHVTHVGGAATGQVRRPMLVALWHSRQRFAAQQGPPWRLQAHRTIVKAGMLRLTLGAWGAYVRGQVTRSGLRERLLAYGEVMRL